MLRYSLIFSFCLASVYCAISLEETVVSDKEKAEGYSCKSIDPKVGLMMEGEEKTNARSDSCARAICIGGTIERASCGKVASTLGCESVSDLTKPYPDCCPKIVCKKDKSKP